MVVVRTSKIGAASRMAEEGLSIEAGHSHLTLPLLALGLSVRGSSCRPLAISPGTTHLKNCNGQVSPEERMPCGL